MISDKECLWVKWTGTKAYHKNKAMEAPGKDSPVMPREIKRVVSKGKKKEDDQQC